MKADVEAMPDCKHEWVPSIWGKICKHCSIAAPIEEVESNG